MENIFNFKRQQDKILKESQIESVTKIKEKIIEEKPFVSFDYDDVIKKQQELKSMLEDKISKYTINDINPFFDKELLDALDILYSFISELNPEAKPYYEIVDGKANINMSAYIDAREYLVNEFAVDPNTIRYNTSKDGVVNLKKIYLKDGYSIDSAGIIKQNDNIVMNPHQNPIISVIDFNKKILVVHPGVFIDVSKNIDKIAEKLYYDNPYIDNKTSPDKIITDISTQEFKELTGIDITDDIKDSATYSDETDMSYCNWGTINYLWLTFLIIIGGGEAGKSPLAAKDGGEVVWDCQRTKSSKRVTTGHPWMYTKTKPVGMKRSVLQIFCDTFGSIFKANIKWYVKVFKKKIGFELCVGGWLEYSIFLAQRWFSKELSKLVCEAQKSTINSAGNKGVDLDYIKQEQKNSTNANISAMSGDTNE